MKIHLLIAILFAVFSVRAGTVNIADLGATGDRSQLISAILQKAIDSVRKYYG